MATSPDRLPEMLACTLHLHDAVRAPGSTLTGSVIISLPTASALALLHPDASAAVDFQQQQQATNPPATPPSRRWIGTPSPSAAASESASLLSPSALGFAPLARPFEFELRLQLYGKVVVDGHKVSLASLQRFRPVSATGSAAHMASFKLWSTRVVSWTIPADGGFPRVHAFRATLPDCLPPSFRGSALTCHYYLHAIALAVGGVGKKLMDVKLPFRVRVGDAPMMLLAGDAGARMANLIEVPSGLATSMQHCLMTTPSQWTAAKLLEASPPAALASSQSSTHLLAATPAAHSESLSADEASALLLTSTSPAVSLSPPVAAADSDPSSHHQREGSNPAAAATAAAPRLLPSPLHLTHAPAPLGVELGAALASASRRSSFSSAGGGSGGPASAAASSPFGVPLSMLEQPLAPLTFNISKTVAAPHTPEGELSAHVVRLTLDQRFLRPGDTLRGHLDFSRAGIRCYRVAIALQQEERVQEDYALPSTGGQHPSPSSSSSGPFTHRKTFASFHQYTVNTLSTHFLFCLPLDVVANFQTDLTAVSWQLQFKFITDVDLHPKHSWSFLPAPSSTHAEALVWTLPLTVMPHDDAEVVKQRSIKTMLISSQSFVP